MPIFEFECRECGKVAEFLVRNTETDKSPVCPSCKSNNLIRVFSMPKLQKFGTPAPGHTCCGREQRCDSASGGSCCGS